MIKTRMHLGVRKHFRMNCSGFIGLNQITLPLVYTRLHRPPLHPAASASECVMKESKIWLLRCFSFCVLRFLEQKHFTLAKGIVWVAESWHAKRYSANMERFVWKGLCV